MRVSILGATGSIGQNTLDLVRRNPERFDVVALSGGRNIDQLARDAREFRPAIVVTAHEAEGPRLREALAGTGIAVAAGEAALIEAASRPTDWVMSAIVGVAGLAPGLAALGHTQCLALANKESLVSAGALLMARAAANGTTILPVDSEHSGVFQLLLGERVDAVTHVTLTASGGAFRDWPLAKLAEATPDQAATHPNWDMGQRITIDSASLFNKALEVIEAAEFFALRPDQIEVLIHPESIVHALVAFQDGGVKAHLGAPDMRHAIGFALNYPERAPLPVAALDLAALGALTFRPWEAARAPALRLAYQVLDMGGMAGAVFNAAKEAALDAFIARQVGFLDMARLVEQALSEAASQGGLTEAPADLDAVRHWDHFGRERVRAAIGARAD